MIIFGGYIGGNLSNDSFIFDLETNNWTPCEINEKPLARADHKCVLHGNHMWLYGGKNLEGHLDDL